MLPLVLVPPFVPFPPIGASDGAGVLLAGERNGCVAGDEKPVPPDVEG
jgi:hypothetical protein